MFFTRCNKEVSKIVKSNIGYDEKVFFISSCFILVLSSLSVVFRKGGGSMGGDTFLFGSSMVEGGPTAWRWIGASFNYGIGITHKDITFKLLTGYGLLNHFKKDYTAQYLGYPVYINHPIVGSVMFNW